MSKQALLFLILAALLPAAGCLRYRAQPIEPQRTESDFRRRSLDDPGLRAFAEKQSAVRSDWPPASLDLESLTTITFYYSSELDLARARLRSAWAGITSARARINPILAFGVGYESGPEAPLIFRFDPTLTLVTAGKTGCRILQAEKLAEAARIELAETGWRLRSRLRSALIDHMSALQALELLGEERGLREEKVAMQEKRLAVGEASRPELDIARAEVFAAGASVRSAEGAAGSSLADLAEIASVPAQALADRGFDWPGPVKPLPEADLALARLQQAGLLHRLDVQRSLMEYAASEALLQLEVARQYPDLEFTPGYSFDEGHNKIMLSPGFTIPWPNRNRGPIAEAECRRAESEARFMAVQSLAIGDLERTGAEYRAAVAELAVADKALTLHKELEGSTLRAFELGEADRLALAARRLARLAAAGVRLEVFRKVQRAFGALEDAVQQPLPAGRPRREIPAVSPRAMPGKEYRP